MPSSSPEPVSIVATSEPYSIGRMEIVFGTAFHYLRTFWPFIITVPVGGIFFLIFIPVYALKILGVMMLAWPLTIPARIGILSFGLWRHMRVPTVITVAENGVFFAPEGKRGTRIPWTWARRVMISRSLYIIDGVSLKSVVFSRNAFSAEDLAAIDAFLNKHRLLKGKQASAA